MTARAHEGEPAFALARDRGGVVSGVLGLLVAMLFVVSLAIGPASLSLLDALPGLAAWDERVALIVWEIRLPRAILGVLVGATLGLSGAALQGFLRNPLAEPGLIGTSGAAALGAVIAFYFGLAAAFPLALPLGGMLGALLAVVLVYLLAGRASSILTLILAGVAINSFTAALTSLALNLAPSPYAALEIVLWLLGSLADRSFDHVWMAAPFMVAGWFFLAWDGRALAALSLGDDTARSLGVNLERVRFRLIAGTAMAVGAAVSVTGVIGFVGLVVPHMVRPFVGYQPGRLLWPSALGGAALTLTADIATRLVGTDQELKLGVVTALIGAPFFLALVLSTRRQTP